MCFEIVGEIRNIETIAVGGRIRDIMRLRRQFGPGRWRKLKGVATVRLSSGMASVDPKSEFALCIEDRDCDDLEKGKVYPSIPDEDAAKEGYMRIVDESGEDYLYPESYFVLVDLPQKAQDALFAKA